MLYYITDLTHSYSDDFLDCGASLFGFEATSATTLLKALPSSNPQQLALTKAKLFCVISNSFFSFFFI